jgi:hypothetical protein
MSYFLFGFAVWFSIVVIVLSFVVLRAFVSANGGFKWHELSVFECLYQN